MKRGWVVEERVEGGRSLRGSEKRVGRGWEKSEKEVEVGRV